MSGSPSLLLFVLDADTGLSPDGKEDGGGTGERSWWPLKRDARVTALEQTVKGADAGKAGVALGRDGGEEGKALKGCQAADRLTFRRQVHGIRANFISPKPGLPQSWEFIMRIYIL